MVLLQLLQISNPVYSDIYHWEVENQNLLKDNTRRSITMIIFAITNILLIILLITEIMHDHLDNTLELVA